MKRIGINLLYLLPDIVGGTETYARGLLGALSRYTSSYRFTLFLNRELADRLPDEFAAFERVVCPVNAVHREQRYFFEQVKLPSLLRQHRIQLVHSLGYTSPLLTDCPKVVTIHDLNFRAFGTTMPFVRRVALAFFVRWAVLRAQKIITVSEFSRNEIVRAYRISPSKIRVTYEAALMPPQATSSDATLPLQGPYCVAFSSTSANKNIPRLVDAYLLARATGKIPQKLVLIGHPPDCIPVASTDIVFTGYVPRSTMFAILQAADFLIFPSYYEGFGLPILEAMACGVPVVSSNAASMPEVAGSAALYFNPFSIEEMSIQIQNIAMDRSLRSKLRHLGFENVKRFSWDRTARETLAVYDELLSSKPVQVPPDE